MSGRARAILVTIASAILILGIAVAVFRRSDRQKPIAKGAPAGAGEFVPLGFQILSDFKYDLYETPNDVDGGRPFTRSDDVIPPHIRAYDGKFVALTGFVMPLRLRKGLVTEFLLFRDQAACCFGERAKMNHYVRVKLNGAGFPPAGTASTYTAFGQLKVGEILVQGYLTGIYHMEATRVTRQD